MLTNYDRVLSAIATKCSTMPSKKRESVKLMEKFLKQSKGPQYEIRGLTNRLKQIKKELGIQ